MTVLVSRKIFFLSLSLSLMTLVTSAADSSSGKAVSRKHFMAAVLQLQKAVLEAGGVDKLLQSPQFKGIPTEQKEKVQAAAKKLENLITTDVQPRWLIPVIIGIIEAANLIINVYDTFIKDDATTIEP